ncbi:hypothetical protein [Bradyrhizobium roseum]|uniref:hypothetical protein n=1 Tax=Bradyrhizobium roseum TaxID=3056648 RepID=UPI0026151742|nr:hypothetical protein [Bradyrhizobium roseus]WKA29892.1 hypothetical protein QUH67_06880 [Bradyrhizobium roseus]
MARFVGKMLAVMIVVPGAAPADPSFNQAETGRRQLDCFAALINKFDRRYFFVAYPAEGGVKRI